MKLPKSVRIDGLTWAIACSKRKPGWAPAGVVGACDKCERRIWVRQQANPEETMSSLVHELAHAALQDYSGPLAEHMEEMVVTMIEPSLYSLLRDNDLTFIRR